jgi:hypothetical protein
LDYSVLLGCRPQKSPHLSDRPMNRSNLLILAAIIAFTAVASYWHSTHQTPYSSNAPSPPIR